MPELLRNNIASIYDVHGVLLSWLGGLSLLMFIGSLIAVPVLIARLPENYLRLEHKLVLQWSWHISVPLLVLKNGLGAIFVLSGLAMLVLPGQGLLTLFIGVMLLDFPRKRILIRRVLGHRRIFRGINRMRSRLGKPKLQRF